MGSLKDSLIHDRAAFRLLLSGCSVVSLEPFFASSSAI